MNVPAKKGQKSMSYEIEKDGVTEYVIVRCPDGHRMRGQKVGDLKIMQSLACVVPGCSKQWKQLLPMTNGFEGDA